jgi:hypothetical protein
MQRASKNFTQAIPENAETRKHGSSKARNLVSSKARNRVLIGGTTFFDCRFHSFIKSIKMQIFLFIFFNVFVSSAELEKYQKSRISGMGSIPSELINSSAINQLQATRFHQTDSLDLDSMIDPPSSPISGSSQPTLQPSSQPSVQPSEQPSSQPTTRPTFHSRQFVFTGAMETFTVPASVAYINVDITGAAGGSNGGGLPGFGARVQTSIPVTPGSILYIFVGGQGGGSTGTGGGSFDGGGSSGTGGVSSSDGGGSSVTGGGSFDGGGSSGIVGGSLGRGSLATAGTSDDGGSPWTAGFNGGGYGSSVGTGGGGASDIRFNGTDLVHRIIVAGGGGGYDYGDCDPEKGGDGGEIGQTGSASCGRPGGGGTKVSGGSAGGEDAYSGTLGVGGRGGGNFGAGGGGGYYGGDSTYFVNSGCFLICIFSKY